MLSWLMTWKPIRVMNPSNWKNKCQKMCWDLTNPSKNWWCKGMSLERQEPLSIINSANTWQVDCSQSLYQLVLHGVCLNIWNCSQLVMHHVGTFIDTLVGHHRWFAKCVRNNHFKDPYLSATCNYDWLCSHLLLLFLDMNLQFI